MISSRPVANSARLRQRESSEYASATLAGSRVFHPSSAARTFWIAVSRVNGGNGGRFSASLLIGASRRLRCRLTFRGSHHAKGLRPRVLREMVSPPAPRGRLEARARTEG